MKKTILSALLLASTVASVSAAHAGEGLHARRHPTLLVFFRDGGTHLTAESERAVDRLVAKFGPSHAYRAVGYSSTLRLAEDRAESVRVALTSAGAANVTTDASVDRAAHGFARRRVDVSVD